MAQVSGPLERYQRQVDGGRLTPDPRQLELARLLDDRFDALLARPRHWWQRWRRPAPPVKGIYLHGAVGRGKTMLMDLLAVSLDDAGVPIWRIHFHRFMEFVHEQLGQARHQRDPLDRVATEIAGRARVLCLDEFHVNDIGDAMILGELLRRLSEREVILITTSNTEPDNLYADGLQRARFLPAIERIKSTCDVISLDAREDYRLRELSRHPVYHYPEDDASRADLAAEFRALAAGEQSSDKPLIIRGRSIQPIQRAGSVAWFDFATLCDGPRASADYIELARRFSTLIINQVPQLDDQDNNAAKRFVHLVDECYDRGVKLVIAAAVAPQSLYVGERLTGPFERTSSRLIEMQSHDYLARAHEP